MNDFYNGSANLTGNTLARASAVVAEFQSVATGLDKLPTELELKQNRTTYAADTGTANAYVVTLAYAPASLVDGLTIRMKAVNANTGASTINVNGLGAVAVLNQSGGALIAGDIPADSIVELVCVSSQFRITAVTAATVAAVKTLAETAQTGAETAQGLAETAQAAAETAQTGAETAQTAAETAQAGAETAQTNAETAETNAAASAVDAAAAVGGVRVSANDTTPSVLNGKLVAGTGITLVEGNDGGDETLTIASSTTADHGANIQTALGLI